MCCLSVQIVTDLINVARHQRSTSIYSDAASQADLLMRVMSSAAAEVDVEAGVEVEKEVEKKPAACVGYRGLKAQAAARKLLGMK